MIDKKGFIDLVSEKEGLRKKEVDRWTSIILDGIKDAIKRYGGVKFVGFGNFELSKREGRWVRHPKTGEDVFVNSKIRASFSPGKELKNIKL